MISVLNTPVFIRSVGVNGSALNFLIVIVPPRVVTSLPIVASRREPSGRRAFIMGYPVEMDFPLIWTSFITVVSSKPSIPEHPEDAQKKKKV